MLSATGKREPEEQAHCSSETPSRTIPQIITDVSEPSTSTVPFTEEDSIQDDLSPVERECIESLLSLQDQTTNVINKGTQVCSGDLKKSYIINAGDLTEKQLNSLTGIPNLELFNTLSECISEEINFSNGHSLPVKERLLIVFMRLKLNISFSSLAIFFGCTETTVSNIFETFVPILSAFLSLVLRFPSKDEVLANIPKAFENFKETRIVLDCIEIYVQKPKCLFERIQTFSRNLGGHTLKYMIGVTPGGLISYVSKGWGGLATGKTIFVESGLVNMLEPHIDKVMVDKEFLIEDICTEKYIEVIRPPFLRNQEQFSTTDAEKTRQIACAMDIIERVIQRLKIFKLLTNTIPYSIIHLMDHILIIISGITNLSSPVLAEDEFLIQMVPS